jgi:hypothetical protein
LVPGSGWFKPGERRDPFEYVSGPAAARPDALSPRTVDLTSRPYIERRQELEILKLDGHAWTTCERFGHGRALFTAVCELGLEGVVGEEALEPVSAERSRLGEDQEPELLAAGR